MSTRIPIIIGVGDIKDLHTGEGAEEPLYLILQAIYAAARDTRLPPYASEHLLTETDSIEIVTTWTWPYDDLASDLAAELRANPAHKETTKRHGGDQPAKLVDEAARRIASGESRVALVAGGEALASLSAHVSTRGAPPAHWSKTTASLDSVFAEEKKASRDSMGGKHGIGAPKQIYPLYENAFRAYRGQSIQANNIESAQMYADFAKIAEKNEYAWSYGKAVHSEETIGTVSKRNRMISFPYPLLMNAFNNVNLAAACIMTSTDYAHQLGIPESQWVYVRGGAGSQDSKDFLRRPNFHTSPSISRSLDAALDAACLSAASIDLCDFYSCFPIIPKLACQHFNHPMTPPYVKPISILGGLTSFGGAGNNYSMHAITHMTRSLRQQEGKHGLVLANGGVATYQHVICLSTVSPQTSHIYPAKNPLPDHLPVLPESEIEAKPNGEAAVETYTVDFGRDGKPALGHVVGRLMNSGKRFIANHGDRWTLTELSSETREPIGRIGSVKSGEDGRNIFSLERKGKL